MTQPQLPPGAVDLTDDLLATIGELYFQLRMSRKAQQQASTPIAAPTNGQVEHAVRDER